MALAPHSPLHYTGILEIIVTGDSNALAIFKDGLASVTGQADTLESAVSVTGIKPADLTQVLTLAERGDLTQCWEEIRNSSYRG
jgi:hypothetical protein